jgi:hypothetical protein
MRKILLFILLILVSCQPDELMVVEPYPQYEMIFEESMSKVVDGQEYSFEVSSTDEHMLIISHANNSVIAKESFTPTMGLNTKILYTKSLPKGELNLTLTLSEEEIKKTIIIVD